MGSRSVTALTMHLNPDICAFGKDWTLNNPDITLVKRRTIVEAVDLVDAVQAILFTHWLGATWTLLRRLTQKSHAFIFGDVLSICCDYLCSSYCTRHVTIVSTHVCKFSRGRVRQTHIVFRHGKGVKITSKGHKFTAFVIFYRCSSAHNIDDQSCLGDLANILHFNAEALESVREQFLSFKLLKATFGILMNQAPQFNHCIYVTSTSVHLPPMSLI